MVQRKSSLRKSMVDVPVSVAGVRLASFAGGLRYRGRDDMALIELAPRTVTAGVFTRNVFRAAPVIVAQRRLAECMPRYLLVNSGNANAGLGRQGLDDAEYCCNTFAKTAGVMPAEVLPFSTGLIGERLPVARFVENAPKLLPLLSPDNWLNAARAIMTTDTVAKWSSRSIEYNGGTVNLTGIAKGAGMICPGMATMLAFIGTDVALSPDFTGQFLRSACALSFNAITIDGDTSTNDACVLFATGRSAVSFSKLDAGGRQKFTRALHEVMSELAEAIVRDAEGAGHFIRIQVEQAATAEAARRIADSVAHSPLVKTAVAGGDPNWGRILAAVGRAGVDLVPERLMIYLGDVCVVAGGALSPDYDEEDGVRALAGGDVEIRIVLNNGTESASVLSSDLTVEYVRINTQYRS